jgi:hypothetical protein
MDEVPDVGTSRVETRGGRSDVAPFLMSLFLQAVVSFLGYFTLLVSLSGIAGCQAAGDSGRRDGRFSTRCCPPLSRRRSRSWVCRSCWR